MSTSLRVFATRLIINHGAVARVDGASVVVARRDAERTEKTVGDQFMYLDEVMREELAGRGLWIDSSDQTVEQTVDAILEGREQARIA